MLPKNISMKLSLCVVVCLLPAAALLAQVADKRSVRFSNEVKIEDLQKNLAIIAGAEMEGRETGTEGQARAADFIAGYYKRIGLKPGNNGSYFQYYPLLKDSVLQSALNINGREFRYGADYTFPATITNTGAIYTSPELGLEIVWGGYGITDSVYNNLAGIDARGKVSRAGRSSRRAPRAVH